MVRINKKGVSLLETIAAVVILSFVVVSVFTIIVNIRTQTYAANKKINAIEIGTLVRDQIQNEFLFNDLDDVLTGDIVITSNDHDAINNFPTEIFDQTLAGKDYSELITITFHEVTADHSRFGIIDFTITINYFSGREIDMEGIIYE